MNKEVLLQKGLMMGFLSKTNKVLLKDPRKIRQYLRHRRELFLVYSMGKVASSSVHKALKGDLPFVQASHIHFLSDEFLKDVLPGVDNGNNIEKGFRLREDLERKKEWTWKVISLVRDPVGRLISNFFQNPEMFIDGSPEDRSAEELISLLKEKNDQHYALTWFDREMKAFLGFDPYAHPFDQERGYSIYQYASGRQVLIIQMEKLDRVFPEAMKAFTGESFSSLEKANVKKDRPLYREIKEGFSLPEDELNRIYGSKFMKHFYSPEDIRNFKQKWVEH